MKRRHLIEKKKIKFAVVGLVWLHIMSLTVTASALVYPKPSDKDRCPVCGMFAHKYPKWIAGFVFKSGKTYFHCCPKCMLHNLNNITKYQPLETRKGLNLIWVTEYYTTRIMAAEDVFFVTGTRLLGPMGLDLIPIKGREAAMMFKHDYSGERILTIDQITQEIINQAREGKLNPYKE